MMTIRLSSPVRLVSDDEATLRVLHEKLVSINKRAKLGSLNWEESNSALLMVEYLLELVVEEVRR
jgi:hypothetical protein